MRARDHLFDCFLPCFLSKYSLTVYGLFFFDRIDLCMGINALHMLLSSYKLLSVSERFVNSILSLYKIACGM